MDEKDIDKKMQEAWNGQVTEHHGAEKEALWLEFAAQAFPARKKSYRKWLYPAAAVLAVCLTLAAYFSINGGGKNNSPAYTIIENPSAIVKVVMLPDSSVAELTPGAEIRYSQDFAVNRNIKLTGKSYFSVRKDKKHPFSVSCGATTTTVLGTRFTIDGQEQNTVRVNLFEGRVQMNVKGSNSSWILSPGEEFLYQNGTVAVEAFNRFIDFNDTPLSTVANYVKTTYGYTLQLPEEYLNKKITLRLNKKEELQNVIELIAQMYNLTPVKNEKLKKITLQ
jgi:transmembrane sensor